ncbi:syntaxin-binding protein 4 [Rhinophrynus dorsalis]
MTTSIRLSEGSIQTITVTKETSLGLSLIGGINRTEGPVIFIKDIIPGGDCHKDGRLKPGDQLVSINKDSLVGVSCEEAKSILNRAKLRRGTSWEIAFIRAGGTHLDQMTEPSSPAQGAVGFMPKLSSTPGAGKPSIPNQSGHVLGQRLSSPPERSSSDLTASAVNKGRSQGKQISLNPNARFKVEKLEMALNYLGINPTEEQKRALRQGIQIDANGTVSFGEFVQVTKKLFNLQIREGDLGQGPSLLGDTEVTNLLDSVMNQVQSCDLLDSDDRERLKRERNEAYAELKKLQERLMESEKQRSQLSEELKNVKQEAKAAVEETRELRNRIHLAEVAQRQARGMETDYEEVIRLLETEIAELKAELADHSGHSKDSTQDLRRRITVLDCQLRKSELARKTFEVSTEKLLQFVESVHEVLSDDSGSTLNLSERIPAFPSQTLMARLGQNRPGVMAALAAEAKDLARSVRSIVEVDCLPYGWEEAYTADGIKYFINHVTQATSWTHPVTSALSLSCPDDIDPPELKSC